MLGQCILNLQGENVPTHKDIYSLNVNSVRNIKFITI